MLLTSLDPAGCGAVDSVAAVTVGAKSMSRAQLFDAACALAGSLPDGGPVAVCAEPTLDTVIAVTACVLTGVAVVPIPHDSGSAELRHILTDAKVTCWAGPAHLDWDLPVISALERGRGGGELGGAPSADAVAMILYT